ncbi:hypothetical protein QVD17_28824 [Tagetes erecta]|uniref:Pentatricopeptide repeat-containing protein n=1 Tax=Tagetes erecta TaxID=13708 RepID=A0AAD8KB88_TARER|nr:hypothetical protein QVD17_28824 [Tagetes erecta]
MVVGLVRIGEIGNALQVFDEMPERDVVSYTVLIDGFVKKECYEQVLKWFQRMQVQGYQTMGSHASKTSTLLIATTFDPKKINDDNHMKPAI